MKLATLDVPPPNKRYVDLLESVRKMRTKEPCDVPPPFVHFEERYLTSIAMLPDESEEEFTARAEAIRQHLEREINARVKHFMETEWKPDTW